MLWPILGSLLLAISCSSTAHVVDPAPSTSIQIGEIKANKVPSRIEVYRSPDLGSFVPLRQVITVIQGNGISVMFSDEGFFECAKRLLGKEFSLNSVSSQYYDLAADNSTWKKSTDPLYISVELEPFETQSDLVKKYASSGVIKVSIRTILEDKTIWSSRITLEETIAPSGVRMAALTGTYVDAFEKLGKQLKTDGFFPERKMIKVF